MRVQWILGGAAAVWAVWSGVWIPFALAGAVAACIRPAAAGMARRLGGSARAWAIFLSALACGALTWCGVWAVRWLAAAAGNRGESIVETASGMLRALPGWLVEKIPPDFREHAASLLGSLAQKGAEKLASQAALWLTKLASSLPGVFFAVFAGVYALFWMSADWDGVRGAARALLPAAEDDPVQTKVKAALCTAWNAAGAYIGSTLRLETLVFLACAIGLAVLGQPHPVSRSFLVAFVDLLPVLGSGAVLVPWGLWRLLTGHRAAGIGILILSALLWLLRQYLEPRLLGKILGVHPLLALAAAYVGCRAAGVAGMLAAPIVLYVLSSLRSDG